MKRIAVKVAYEGQICEELDSQIIHALLEHGFVWYAQGYNLETETRDIAFDATNLEEWKPHRLGEPNKK